MFVRAEGVTVFPTTAALGRRTNLDASPVAFASCCGGIKSWAFGVIPPAAFGFCTTCNNACNVVPVGRILELLVILVDMVAVARTLVV